jgi:tetratricopeptide (TPR) repeat protein
VIKRSQKTGIVIFLIVAVGLAVFFVSRPADKKISPGASPITPSKTLPAQTLLNDDGYYVHQTFNNCGEAALSMDLSFYGIHESQQALADILRPDNNTTGKNDDKSTPPDEIAAQAETYGLVAYFRPNGNISLLQHLVAAGFPVMTRTLLNTSEDYAHYRVIKGYNIAAGTIIDEDGIQGENVAFSYNDFLTLWKPFNYEYLVFASPAQQTELESILGADVDASTAWAAAAQTATQALAVDPNDTAAEFDLSVADYYTGDYASSVQMFEKTGSALSEHALWYQLEPIESYYVLGDYAKVFSLAQSILSNGDSVYPELYVIEGESYLKEGDTADAKSAFETALQYNKNLKSASDALAAMKG